MRGALTAPGSVGEAPIGLAADRAQGIRLRYAGGVCLLVAMYYGAAHLGYAVGFSGPVAAIVWLPVGVGVAFLYLGGLRFWPGVVIGDLLVNNYSTLPVGSALGQSAGNLLEVVVAVLLLRRLCPPDRPLATIRGVAGMLIAIAAGTFVSATVGAISLALGGVTAGDMRLHVWRTWWLGDFSGALIVLPLALAWSTPPLRRWSRGRLVEGVLTLAAVAALSEAAMHTSDPLAYIVFPALIWAALRFDERGATLAVATTAGFALWGTTHYVGQFVFQSINSSVLNTQLYIAVASGTALAVAALVSERESFAMKVRASRTRLVEASDTERRRLERNLHDGAQQRLVALAARLALAADESREDPSRSARLFETAGDELLLAIDELRDLAHGIHPPVLAEFGLAPAVQAAVAQSATPIASVDLPHRRFDDVAEVTAYYVALEAIANAQKYARAATVRVSGRLVDGALELEVADDGLGGAIERPGSGLEGLRDRVEATGGHFVVDSLRGRGTRIAASIPVTPRG